MAKNRLYLNMFLLLIELYIIDICGNTVDNTIIKQDCAGYKQILKKANYL